MKRTSKLCAILAGALLLTSVAGCSQEEKGTSEANEKASEVIQEYNCPKIDSDFLKVYADEADYTYSNLSVSKTMVFTVISGEKIDAEKFKVELDGRVACHFNLTENEDEQML